MSGSFTLPTQLSKLKGNAIISYLIREKLIKHQQNHNTCSRAYIVESTSLHIQFGFAKLTWLQSFLESLNRLNIWPIIESGVQGAGVDCFCPNKNFKPFYVWKL